MRGCSANIGRTEVRGLRTELVCVRIAGRSTNVLERWAGNEVVDL
jgi:hypothetical protein